MNFQNVKVSKFIGWELHLQVQQKCDFMEKELARAKKNENEMATTIGKLESEVGL